MDVEIPRVAVTLDSEEVGILAYALRHEVHRSVETHWCKLQTCNGSKLAAFQNDRGSKKKLAMMDALFSAYGRFDLAHGYRREFTELLERADRDLTHKQGARP